MDTKYKFILTLPGGIEVDSAEEIEGDQTVMVQVERPASIVAISVPEIVPLELTPDINGLMTVVSSNIYVGTTSTTGYQLYLEMAGSNGTTNSLLNNTDNDKAITSTGTFTNPVPLTNGRWGYAFSSSEDALVDPNGFDANYDTMPMFTGSWTMPIPSTTTKDRM